MKIIILGAGQVGASLTETLAKEGHAVTVVDRSESRLQDLQENLDIRTVAGSCSYPEVLERAGAKNADMLIAVTDSDEANMVACQVAYSLFHTPMKIARIRSQHYFIREELFGEDHLPIDVFISPEELVTEFVSGLMAYPGALQVLDFADGLAKCVAVKPHFSGELTGKSISQIPTVLPNIDLRVCAIFRNEHAISIDGDTVIQVGDEVFIIAATKNIKRIIAALQPVTSVCKRVMIAGGGNIGRSLAKALESKYQIKLIDHNKKRCQRLADTLTDTMVLYGEAADQELLINENIEHADAFISVTDDDEANILSCIQAKRLGAKLVLPLITRTAYVDLIEGGPINIAISPQYATIGSILTHLRQGDIVRVHSLRRGAAEVIEAIAHGDEKTSSVVGRSINALKFPKGVTIGAVVRKEKVLIGSADLVIEPDDHVILFVSNKKRIKEIEKLFQVSAHFF